MNNSTPSLFLILSIMASYSLGLQNISIFSITTILSFFLLFLLQLHGITANNKAPKSYIVYMGMRNGDQSDIEAAKLAHVTLLSSIIPSEESERFTPKHIYHHAFKGFAAMLTEEEASLLSNHEEVVSVFPTPILKLQTTRSWDYLESRSGDILSGGKHHRSTTHGKDVIIGVIDSGIWPESPSFSDEGMGEIPSRWKGVCMEAHDFKKSACNRKLIGARYYSDDGSKSNGSNNGSPRDQNNHGTHTASTAGGAVVANANYKGLAKGTARGGFPSSRLAIYKACPGSAAHCDGSFILKALDDAVHDGVDILSLSIGSPAVDEDPDFFKDPLALGSLSATIEKGIMVITAGGNDGPRPYTVSNTAPWLFTVAASTIDRAFGSSIVLGNGPVVQGYSINFSKLKRSGAYPLAFGGDVAINSSSTMDARKCIAESLDKKKIDGKILVCYFTGTNENVTALFESAKPRGTIYVNNTFKVNPVDGGEIPFVGVDNVVGAQILKYIKSTKNPKATILPTVDINKFKPAPVVADFSSRGPGHLTEAILKPDITAPGVGILASIPPRDFALGKPTEFGVESGTSMATPHVSGVAAYIKSLHPDWTPSIIKSALMTTATISNNLGQPITNSSDAFSDLHEIGAGEISPTRALNPGLAYETTLKDYLKFLCYYGYSEKFIRQIVDKKFHCPRKSSKDLISDINYPSISISKLQGSRTIMRTVTNVGPKKSTYIAKINSPTGLIVQVSPRKLIFTEGSTKASYKVSFTKKGATKGYKFGSIIWSDGMHFVRSVFAVNVV